MPEQNLKQRVVVIGNGMVGHHYVDRLIQTGAEVAITVIGGEPRPAYDRVHLSEFFGGKSAQDLALTTREFYQQNQVDAHFGDPVVQIDREAKVVRTERGGTFNYDKLILATGSYPFVPPIPGNDLPHCFTYRTIDDLVEIKASGESGQVGVVVGGGLLGLECANALHQMGMEAHVVEFAPGLMGVQLDEDGSAMLRTKIESLGVRVHTSKATQAITLGRPEEGDQCRLKMAFADGDELDTDTIVFSAGIRPYDSLARDCGLEVGERGGIVIDDYCQTSDHDIYAIGECALWEGRILGLVAPGYRMAEVAVSQLTAEKSSFRGADMSTKLKLLGVDVGSIGDSHGKTPGAVTYTFCDPGNEVYKSMVVSEEGSRLLGAVLVGDASDYDTLLQYYLNGIDLPAHPGSLILPDAEGGATGIDPASLPATATICSCHQVSKADILAALDDGCRSVSDVQVATRASTGCGSCATLLQGLLDQELKSRDITADSGVAESSAVQV